MNTSKKKTFSHLEDTFPHYTIDMCRKVSETSAFSVFPHRKFAFFTQKKNVFSFSFMLCLCYSHSRLPIEHISFEKFLRFLSFTASQLLLNGAPIFLNCGN